MKKHFLSGLAIALTAGLISVCPAVYAENSIFNAYLMQAIHYRKAGDYDNALKAAQLALDESARLGSKPTSRALALNTMGLIYSKQKNLAKAQEKLLEAAQIYQAEKLPQDQAMCLENISSVSAQGGNDSDAQKYMLQAIELRKSDIKALSKAKGKADLVDAQVLLADSFVNMGYLQYKLKNTGEADSYFKQGVELYGTALGADSGKAKAIMYEIYRTYIDDKETAKAQQLVDGFFSAALKETSEKQGLSETEYRERVARAMNSFGVAVFERGQNKGLIAPIAAAKDSEPIFEKAIDIYDQLHKVDKSYAFMCDNLSTSYRSTGYYDKAEEYAKKGLAAFEKIAKPNDENIYLSLNNLSAIYRDKNEYDKAIPLLIRTVEHFKDTKQDDRIEYATALHNLGCVYYEKKDYGKAKEYLEQAMPIYMRHSVDEKGIRKMLFCYDYLSKAYDDLGDRTSIGLNLELSALVRTIELNEQLKKIFLSEGKSSESKAKEFTTKGTDNDPGVLGAVFIDCIQNGNHKKAQEFFKRKVQEWDAVAGRITTLEHKNKFKSEYLGLAYAAEAFLQAENKEYAAAEDNYKKAIACLEAKSNNSMLPLVVSSYADLMKATSREKEAEILLKAANKQPSKSQAESKKEIDKKDADPKKASEGEQKGVKEETANGLEKDK